MPTLSLNKETLRNIRYVGTIENDIDRMIFKGKWLMDEGEFDEESFNLDLGESFSFQSELGTSLEDSFSLPKHCIQLKGEFEMPLLNGVRKNYSEVAELKITDLPSFQKECCIPIESRNLGLFGLEGYGQNHIGKFRLLGSFQPSSSRFWITKTYLFSKTKNVDLDLDEESENKSSTSKTERLSKQMNNIINTMETLESDEEEQVKMSSFKSMSLVVKNVLTNMSSMMTLQSQLMSTCTQLKEKIAELETQNHIMELKYENSLRIFSEKLEKNDEKFFKQKEQISYESGYSVKDFKDLKNIKIEARHQLKEHQLKDIKRTFKKVLVQPLVQPLVHPKKSIKTRISDEEKHMLPDMIACLSEHQMIALMNKVKIENVFPVPSCQGEFEIDMSTLSEKQLLQFFILVESVQNLLPSTLGKRVYSSFAGCNENDEEF
jgi:hypothetical protein